MLAAIRQHQSVLRYKERLLVAGVTPATAAGNINHVWPNVVYATWRRHAGVAIRVSSPRAGFM